MLINKHKQQLKKVMLMEHQELFGQQNSNKNKRALSFSWYKKIALLLPIPALVLLGVLFFKKPAEKNQPSSWLAQAQEIYEQDLIKQANSVLHQKYIIPMGIMGGGNEEGVQWQNPETVVETWKSKDGFVSESKVNDKLTEKSIDLYDPQGLINKHYSYSNEPVEAGEAYPESEVCPHEFKPNSNTIYCHEQGVDRSDSEATVDDALNSETPQSRTEALQAILENKEAIDKGTIDGDHVFEVNSNDQTIEYHFDENNYTLKKWVSKNNGNQDFIVNYLIDEYLDTTLDQIPSFNDRTGMTEQVVCNQTQEEKDNERMIKEKIVNLPTGCYTEVDGELIKDDTYDIKYNNDGGVEMTRKYTGECENQECDILTIML